jgi:hypothetical protein
MEDKIDIKKTLAFAFVFSPAMAPKMLVDISNPTKR